MSKAILRATVFAFALSASTAAFAADDRVAALEAQVAKLERVATSSGIVLLSRTCLAVI